MAQELTYDTEHFPEWKPFKHFAELKEILSGLLEKDPAKRLTARKALRLPLFKLSRLALFAQNSTLILESMRFRKLPATPKMKNLVLPRTNVIKQGVLLYIATRLLPPNRYQDLTQTFQTMDFNADGYLSTHDLKCFMNATSIMASLLVKGGQH